MADIFGKLIRDWNEVEHAVTSEASDWFHRDTHGTQAPAVMPVNLRTSPHEGEPMSLLDTVKAAVADVEAKVEGIDETALAKLKALQANPGAMKLIDTALPILHIPPEEFDVVVGVLAKIGSYWTAPDAAGQASQAA